LGDVTIYGWAGVLGVLLYLAAYGALQLGFLRGSSWRYTVLNMIAAASILFSLLENWNLFSALIQIFWILISIIGLSRRLWLRSQLDFSAEDTGFLATHLPTLPPIEAHRITRLGVWGDRPPGARLARQGEEVGGLLYLAQGRAAVEVDGRQVASLGPGALVGEMTLMHGGAATADVTVTEAARVLVLPRAGLLTQVDRSPEIALALGHALQVEVQSKLMAMNTHDRQTARPV